MSDKLRFFSDHGMIHDRVTGKHIVGDDAYGIAAVADSLAILNGLVRSSLTLPKAAGLLDCGQGFVEVWTRSQIDEALASAPESTAKEPVANDDMAAHIKTLPRGYLETKLLMVVPLLQEARDALPAISIASAKLHGVDLALGDRMDAAGTYSLDDWLLTHPADGAQAQKLSP